MTCLLTKKLADEGLMPACGGNESPFTFNGVQWIFCWHQVTNQRLYYNITESKAVWSPRFHPVTDPQYEYIGTLNAACMLHGVEDAYF